MQIRTQESTQAAVSPSAAADAPSCGSGCCNSQAVCSEHRAANFRKPPTGSLPREGSHLIGADGVHTILQRQQQALADGGKQPRRGSTRFQASVSERRALHLGPSALRLGPSALRPRLPPGHRTRCKGPFLQGSFDKIATSHARLARAATSPARSPRPCTPDAPLPDRHRRRLLLLSPRRVHPLRGAP